MNARTLSMLPGLTFLCLLVLVSPVAAAPSWNTTIVSDPGLYSIYSDVSGDYLIYAGSIGDPLLENSTRVIQLYSLSTGKQTRIATSDPGLTLTGEGIDGNYAVWFSEPQLESTTDVPDRIFLYAIAEKNTTVIGTGSGVSWPKISGKSVIWTASGTDALASAIMRYDIPTGTRSPVPGINTLDGASVGFDGKNILYLDGTTANLLLYDLDTGTTTTVFATVNGNNTREIVFGSALGGGFALYRKDVQVEEPREAYSELCLYSIPTGKTTLLSPTTGEAITTLSNTDKQATFNVQGADETRLVWDVAESIGSDRIMVLDPATMNVSSLSQKSFVDYVHIDGRNMTWLGVDSLGGKGSIFLATESDVPDLPAATPPTPAPGFGLIVTAVGLLAGVLLVRKRP